MPIAQGRRVLWSRIFGRRSFKSEFGGEMVEHGRFLCVNKLMLYRIGALAVRILRKLK